MPFAKGEPKEVLAKGAEEASRLLRKRSFIASGGNSAAPPTGDDASKLEAPHVIVPERVVYSSEKLTPRNKMTNLVDSHEFPTWQTKKPCFC